MSETKSNGETEQWLYDGYRMGRATRTVEVSAPAGSNTIEEGTVLFEPLNAEDTHMWEEDGWISHYVAPDGGIGFEGGVALRYDKVGIIEFPRPMTEEQASEWLNENPEEWRQHLDTDIESDISAADYLEELR